ncbi:hypothetical protein DFH94DRAFT_841317 [Russula ochroleuca]|jgi:hypothetical protein|uniref:Uncharacterized protein n=1 Tax=Russula ochroleuca TaxID=152965 RepID=A0A9P5TE33_9AGAM|nr:hypothetical protein DFH94DRAFT_841317 [Russula ochroleuca]
MLPISNVDFLSVSATDIDDSVNWVGLSKHLTKVDMIQVIGRGRGTSSLVRALPTPKATTTKLSEKGKKKRRDNKDNTQARSTGAPADAPTIFPKLANTALNTLDFNEGPHRSGILFNVVERGLQQRKATNKAPLKEPRIDNCVIIVTAKRAKALQKLVQQFHWDDDGFPDEFEDFGDYDLDIVEPGARREDFSLGPRRLSESV